MTRGRNGIVVCGVVAALLSPATLVFAQSYPNRVIRWVIPVAPGGSPDLLARALAPRLTELLGQPVVVDNRAGGNAMIGAELVARAPADGYTWLLATGQHTVTPALVKKMPYDIIGDFAPVALIMQASQLLTVHPSVPAKSVRELIAVARARPGRLNYGSGGLGSAAYMSGELFKSMAKVEMAHISYKGAGPALIDLLGGHLDLMFPAILSSAPYHKAGRLRGLGVTSARRHPSLPDLPAVAEAGLPGYQTGSWYGILVPAATPRDIVNRVNAAVLKLVNAADIRDALIAQGGDPETGTPEELARLMKEELARSAAIVKSAGVKPE
jgi:tripartite-type tricarboxylate transporter receptor subunit TctC